MAIDIDPGFNNALVAVGNNPCKALTLGAMRENEIYGRARIFNELVDLQEGDPAWRFSRNLPFSYMRTFFLFGLVDPHDGGFMKNELGAVIGEAVAGTVLRFQEQHPEIPLATLFGTTSLPGSVEAAGRNTLTSDRPPVTRFKILWELATSPNPIRTVDLNQNIEGPQTLGAHLSTLANLGVLNYEFAVHNDNQVAYRQSRIDDFNIDPISNYISLTKEVTEFLSRNNIGEFNYGDLWRALGNTTDATHSQVGALGMIMRSLERHGAIVQVSEFSQLTKSRAWLSPDQRDLLGPFITDLDGINQGDRTAIERGRDHLSEVIDEPARVRELMQMAREGSSYGSGRNTLEDISLVVNVYPNMSASQIRDKISEEFGYSIHGSIVYTKLQQLAEEGSVTFIMNKDIALWSV